MHETFCMFDNQLVQKVIFQTPSPPSGTPSINRGCVEILPSFGRNWWHEVMKKLVYFKFKLVYILK